MRIEPVCRSENAFSLETSTSIFKSNLAVSDRILRTRDVPCMENVACLQNGDWKPSKTEATSLQTISLIQSEGIEILDQCNREFSKRRFSMICNAYCPQIDGQPFSTVRNLNCFLPVVSVSQDMMCYSANQSLWLHSTTV